MILETIMSHEFLEHHAARVLVDVNCKAWELVNFNVRNLCSSAVLATLNEVEMAKLSCEVSIVLAGDNFVQNLNKIWRAKDQKTNVLAFPCENSCLETGIQLVGDIVVAFGTTKKEAVSTGRSIKDHLAHLIVHGTLHLFGHAHCSEKEADIMETKEIYALARMGISDPYSNTRD